MPRAVRKFESTLLWSGLTLLVGLGLVTGLEIATGPGPATLSYLRPMMLIGLTWVLCGFIARLILSSEYSVEGSILLLLAMLPLFDPYSSGRIGGDANVQFIYPWQVYATVASTCLLLAAGVLLVRNHIRHTPAVITLETAVFVVANWLYIQRDGFELRGFSGYWASPFPLLTVVFGALLRPILLLLLFRDRRRIPPHAVVDVAEQG